jgi:hypothetical protein
MSKKGKILGVAYGGGHANCVLPVLNELSQRGHEVLFLGLTSSIPQGKKSGLPMKTYRDYLHLTDKEMAYELGQPLAEKMHNPNLGIDIDESIYYLGVNLLENRNSLGQELADEAFAKAGRHSFLPVELLKGILREEKPDILITTNSPKSEKAALIAATQMGIKSVRIEDLYGVPATPYRQLKIDIGAELYDRTINRLQFLPSLVCTVCAYTQEVISKAHSELGFSAYKPERFSITGQPAFEAIDQVIQDKPHVDLFSQRKQYPTITWAHQNVTPDGELVFSLLRGWQQKYSREFNFVIKVHPNMQPHEIESMLKSFDCSEDNVKIVHKEIDPNILLWNSDVVIAQDSTLLTQAAYMNKPIVVLDPTGRQRQNPLTMNGMAPIAKDENELNHFLTELIDLNSSLYKKFLSGKNKIGYQTSGITNIADEVTQLLGDH